MQRLAAFTTQIRAHKDIALLLLLVFGVFVMAIFKVSGTSIHYYCEAFESKTTGSPNLLMGTPKFIRADEWNLSTSFTISQSLVGYPEINPFLADGQQMSTIMDAPSNHWSTIFKPANHIFFLSNDVEFAFAFKWWLRAAVLLFATYLLLKKLTKNSILSLLAGGIVLFTPFIQWWYSTPAVETISYTFLCVFFLLNILSETRRKHIFLNMFGLIYFTIAGIVMLYPPFLISVALGAFALIVGYILNNRREISTQFLGWKLLSLVLAAVAVGAVMSGYYISLKETIDIILNTEYPGDRFLTGGGMDIRVLFSGYFNFQLPDLTKPVPNVLVNQSEASNFYLVGLLLVPILLFRNIKALLHKLKPDYMTLFLCIYLVAGIVWVLFGFNDQLAKVTFMSKVPIARMLIGIGIWSYILAFYYISKVTFLKTLNWKILLSRGVLVIAFTGLHFYLIETFRGENPTWLSSLGMTIVIVSALITSFSLMFNLKYVFLISMLVFSAYSIYRVNPFYRGLGAVNEIKLVQEIKRIDTEAGGKSHWAIFNDVTLGNLLIANGVHTINGTHIYPQFKLWETLDPERKFNFYYDRYAHINLRPAESGFKFIDIPQSDLLLLEIDPCSDFFSQNKVEFIVSAVELNKSCLTPLNSFEIPDRKMFIYKLN